MAQSRRADIIALIIATPRRVKQVIQVVCDACILTFAAFLVPWLLGGSTLEILTNTEHQIFLAVYIPFGLCILWRLGFYRRMIRKPDPSLPERAVLAFLGLTLLAAAIFLDRTGLAKALALGILCSGAGAGFVVLSRPLARILLASLDPRTANARPVLVYGAGHAGVALVDSLRDDPQYRAAAFIDDDPSLRNIRIGGLTVYPSHKLEELSQRFDTKRVALAIPSLDRTRRREIMEHLDKLSFKVFSVPTFSDLLSGQVEISELQRLDMGKLLSRDNVDLMENPQHDWLRGRTVLITGAGGTIGAELSRLVARLGVRRLILLDVSEPALYAIHRELADWSNEDVDDGSEAVELTPFLGSVTDPALVKAVFDHAQIDAVIHAAAYKHVPLVETNALAGIQNNVLGTNLLAEAAGGARVSRFLLVSTDKAVRPVGAMGATKRLAELSVGAAQARHKKTVYSMVRFGNVLGSSGSVVPRFEQQIRNGGPVTVTHPEITRFFMTVTEAAQLVITAGLQAKGGEVFVLDMGQPVKILDLARRMIQMTGASVKDDANPDGEIDIQITGLRPGEKLHEELLIGEGTSRTPHPGIFVAQESRMEPNHMATLITDLARSVEASDLDTALRLIGDALPDYTPSPEIGELAKTQDRIGDGADSAASGPLRVLPGGRD